MFRCLFFVILYLGFLPQIVLGVPFQMIDGLPNSYTPGQPVMFDVRLPAISNLGSYNIDLVLESTVGTAGVDFFFDVAATVPASMNYVFPSSANFFDAVNVDSQSRHRITLTDFDLVGIDVVPAANDRVAAVVIQTAATFSGQLALFADTDGLILDTPDITPTPVPGFDSLRSDIAEGGTSQLPAVPEPTTQLLCLACILFGSHFLRREHDLRG